MDVNLLSISEIRAAFSPYFSLNAFIALFFLVGDVILFISANSSNSLVTVVSVTVSDLTTSSVGVISVSVVTSPVGVIVSYVVISSVGVTSVCSS